jgi:hypothetical protein
MDGLVLARGAPRIIGKEASHVLFRMRRGICAGADRSAPDESWRRNGRLSAGDARATVALDRNALARAEESP